MENEAQEMQNIDGMQVASAGAIGGWFDDGVAQGAAYMFIIYDSWDFVDYPLYAASEEEARSLFSQYRGTKPGDIERLMEVYDLRMDRNMQLAEDLAMHPPVLQG